MSKPVVKGIIWLLLCFVITFLLFHFLFNWSFSETIDIHLHDTFFIFPFFALLLPAFLFITFILFFVKGVKRDFDSFFEKIFLLSTGFLLITSIPFVVKELTRMGVSIAWTAYPPLSALADKTTPVIEIEPAFHFITNGLIIIQILITIGFVYVMYCWGKQKKQP